MRLIYKFLSGSQLAAFFFFSWVVMMLWNAVVAGHLGLTKPLSYLQACGLWFLATLLFAWAGLGARWAQSEERLERRLRRAFARFLAREDFDWEDLPELLERRLKEKIRGWLQE